MGQNHVFGKSFHIKDYIAWAAVMILASNKYGK